MGTTYAQLLLFLLLAVNSICCCPGRCQHCCPARLIVQDCKHEWYKPQEPSLDNIYSGDHTKTFEFRVVLFYIVIFRRSTDANIRAIRNARPNSIFLPLLLGIHASRVQ
ncbi:hypothetical protein FOQG_03458 [Fusarium oxysporum f. sp. raphani 54005]|uniref:4Fe-4S ferredoxin-type domain-containing protein n=1 Tax=Fusarium oxysporum f. sp. raphani 54005 TaxID=1089458 RepID=X0DQ31_FUSOX|nr:hypothetical protein FOQG_03458 [Fusarium oxysporum f. sp. raphani 54005]